MFTKGMLNFTRPKCKETSRIDNPIGMTLQTRVRLGLNRLKDHKFDHNFRDCINPISSCSLSVENKIYFFLHCRYFSLQREILMNNIKLVKILLMKLIVI